MLLFKKAENKMFNTFHEISDTMMYFSYFWMLTPFPLDTEFSPKMSVSICFSKMACEEIHSPCYPAQLLYEWICELREDSFSNYVCSFSM